MLPKALACTLRLVVFGAILKYFRLGAALPKIALLGIFTDRQDVSKRVPTSMGDEVNLRTNKVESPRTPGRASDGFASHVTAPAPRGGSPSREMTGYLMKRGRNLNMRHRRFISLRGRTLSQHKDEHATPTWSVDVAKTRVQSGPRPLELLVHYDGKVISFFAESEAEFSAWLDALRAASRTVEDWYTIGKQIGRGSYGVVHVGTDSRTGARVAIKIIKKNPASRRQSKFIEREVKYVILCMFFHIPY